MLGAFPLFLILGYVALTYQARALSVALRQRWLKAGAYGHVCYLTVGGGLVAAVLRYEVFSES